MTVHCSTDSETTARLTASVLRDCDGRLAYYVPAVALADASIEDAWVVLVAE